MVTSEPSFSSAKVTATLLEGGGRAQGTVKLQAVPLCTEMSPFCQSGSALRLTCHRCRVAEKT